MKHVKIMILLLVAFLFVSCDFLSGNAGMSNVRIDLGGPADASARWIGIPPSGISSYTVTVSASDMQTVKKTVSAGSKYVNLYIPAGKDRTIRLDANLDPVYAASINREHLRSYAGERTVDLLPGRIIGLRFTMSFGELKIMVPDYYGSYVASINSMTSTSPADWSGINITLPNDIAYDGTGLMYVVTGIGSNVLTLNDVLTGGPGTLVTSALPNINAITVDSRDVSNIIVYYSNGTGIRRYNGTESIVSLPTDIITIYSLQFEDGILFGTGMRTPLYDNVVFRYTPGGATIAATSPNMRNPRDVLIKGNRLYVTNFPQNPDYIASIEVFDKDTLTFMGSYGARTNTPDDNRLGYFYGPYKFIVPRNKKIYIIDDGDPSSEGRNRIVAFNDVETWDGWESLHAEDLGQTEFRFWTYSGC